MLILRNVQQDLLNPKIDYYLSDTVCSARNTNTTFLLLSIPQQKKKEKEKTHRHRTKIINSEVRFWK